MSWWDRIVDWGAEAIGYEDVADYSDFAGDVYSAGRQLVSDVDDFLESDTFGFIKKGAKAYGMLAGLFDADGKRTGQQPFKQARTRQSQEATEVCSPEVVALPHIKQVKSTWQSELTILTYKLH
jgi:hypothetical protein